MTDVLSYEESELLITECLVVLKDEGYSRDRSFRKQVRLSFQVYVFDTSLVPVESMPVGSTTICRMVTKAILSSITLQFALRFSKHGVKSVSSYGSLDQIKSIVVDLLYGFEYLSDKERLSFNNLHVLWASCPLWEEVARKDGLSEDAIKAAQAPFKKSAADLKPS